MWISLTKTTDKIGLFVSDRAGLLLLLLLLLLLVVVVVSFMHGIYYYIPETNRVSLVYNVAAVIRVYIKFVLHVMLFRP